MAHKRRTKLKRKRLPDPEDVLAGRVDGRPEELFDLIHEVNPTSKKMSQAEAARRYRTKSRLQSLLIRRFGDEHLAVRPDPNSPNVVSLEHRAGLRDACHAVLSELDGWTQLEGWRPDR